MDEDFKKAAEFHGHICPGLAMGYRVAKYAREHYPRSQDEELVCIAENKSCENGMLVIEARQEKYQDSYFTSARLKTQGLKEFQYGRIEARLKVPAGAGLWPAFWMLGK